MHEYLSQIENEFGFLPYPEQKGRNDNEKQIFLRLDYYRGIIVTFEQTPNLWQNYGDSKMSASHMRAVVPLHVIESEAPGEKITKLDKNFDKIL